MVWSMSRTLLILASSSDFLSIALRPRKDPARQGSLAAQGPLLSTHESQAGTEHAELRKSAL